ncbi:TMEM175 family protein [Hamadaea sp. NPDC051192]|uniref:TMEM175 family protein n=1 Tax=Hamadaea sp. NPDC051192 TaxID=3154940 RepID=UPI0034381DA3
MTERPKIAPESGHGLERVIFFSDAVIAIALTLLAIELPVPSGDEWVHQLQEYLGSDYVAFLISFAVIATLWFNHHRMFQQIARLTYGMIWLNILGLFTIVLMPFATKILTGLGDLPAGPIFYSGVMVLWAVVWILMVLTATRQKLWSEDAPATAPGNMIFGASALLVAFGLSIPIAFVNSDWATFFWISAWPISSVGMRIRRSRLERASAQ